MPSCGTSSPPPPLPSGPPIVPPHPIATVESSASTPTNPRRTQDDATLKTILGNSALVERRTHGNADRDGEPPLGRNLPSGCVQPHTRTRGKCTFARRIRGWRTVRPGPRHDPELRRPPFGAGAPGRHDARRMPSGSGWPTGHASVHRPLSGGTGEADARRGARAHRCASCPRADVPAPFGRARGHALYVRRRIGARILDAEYLP